MLKPLANFIAKVLFGTRWLYPSAHYTSSAPFLLAPFHCVHKIMNVLRANVHRFNIVRICVVEHYSVLTTRHLPLL